jgi:hypothetical protein
VTIALALLFRLSSMFSSVAPSSSPPSSVEKKHGMLCRLKTAIKKTFGKPKGKEFKQDPRVTVCLCCFPFDYKGKWY